VLGLRCWPKQPICIVFIVCVRELRVREVQHWWSAVLGLRCWQEQPICIVFIGRMRELRSREV
jgi:hypothetical protein